MAFTTHLLVVANKTVDAPELLDAIHQRAAVGPIHVTMLAPCGYSERGQAQQRLESAAARLGASGIESDAMLGDADPIVAVQEAWDPGRYDEVIVSTLAEGASRWLQVDLPHRVAKLTDCQVRHVAVPTARPQPKQPSAPPPARPMLERVASLMRSGTRSDTT